MKKSQRSLRLTNLADQSEVAIFLLLLFVLSGCTGESQPTSKKPKKTIPDAPAQKATVSREIPQSLDSKPVEPKLKREDLPELTEEQIAQADNLVLGSCSRCHAPLPADALPKSAWEKVILSRAEMSGPWNQPPPTPEELSVALYWY